MYLALTNNINNVNLFVKFNKMIFYGKKQRIKTNYFTKNVADLNLRGKIPTDF